MQKIPLFEISTPAASGVVTLNLDQLIGRRIFSIILAHGYAGGANTVAGAAANVAEARLIINSQVKRRVSGVQWLDKMLLNGLAYGFNGLPNPTSEGTMLTMPFAEAWRQDKDQRDITALPTVWNGGGISNMRLELTLGAAGTPTLAAWAVVDDVIPSAKNPGMIEWQQWSISAGSGEFDYSVKQAGVLVGVSVYPDGAATPANRARLTIDGKELFDMTDEANDADMLFNGLTPAAAGRTAGVFDVVLDRDDNLERSELLTGRTVNLRLFSAAPFLLNTITGIADVMRPILA